MPDSSADPNPAGAVSSTFDPRPPAVLRRDELIACEECDAVYQRRELGPSQLARCVRCGSVIERGHRLGLDGLLALSVAALLVFLMANFSPIVTLEVRGTRAEATLAAALFDTWNLGQRLVAAIAAITACIAPLFVILLRLYVIGFLAIGRVPPAFCLAMQALRHAARWSMVEVLMLGTLVSIVRVAGLANVIPGVGIFSFGALVFLLAGIETAGMHRLWESADALRGERADPPGGTETDTRSDTEKAAVPSGAR